MTTHPHHPEEPEVDDSQVRTIIRQLNEDAPSKEKGREVVVRPDGSKMVRVTKKRRMLISKEEKSRSSRRYFMHLLFAFILLLAGVSGFFFYRMTTMSGEGYLMNRAEELQQLWGATSVRCTGAVIDGVNLHISNVVAEFPEGSMVQRVELSELEAEMDLGSFFTGIISGGELKVARAHIHLHPSARRLQLPQAQGRELWRFLRVSCPDFSVSFAGEEASPWSIRHSNAYMYRPSSSSPMTVVTLEGGNMQMRGWKSVNIQSAKLHFSKLAIEDFTLSGTTDVGDVTLTDSARSTISFSGSLADGAELAGPFYFTADNMNFSEFSAGRFSQFFAARTVRPHLRSGVPTTQMRLPLERPFPQFFGSFHLKDVSLSGFPAQQLIVEHLEPAKRKRYLPPSVLFASVRLEHDGSALTLSFDESGMTERDVITMRGSLRVDEMSELSGTLDYGIPAVLNYVEYRDGKADPIFREDGQFAWLSTTVSGPAARPQDNSHELEAAASVERTARERIPFDDIDLDRVNEFFRNREQMLQGNLPAATPEAASAPAPAPAPQPAAESAPAEQAPAAPAQAPAPAPSGDERLSPSGSLSPSSGLGIDPFDTSYNGL